MAEAELDTVKSGNGDHLISPCMEVLAFSRTSLEHGAPGMLAFYQAFLERWGAGVTFYRTNTMSRVKKATNQTLEMLPFWLQDKASLREKLLGLRLHGGRGGHDYALPAFEMFSDQSNAKEPCSFFRMAVPLEATWQDPGALLALVREALAKFPLHWGYAGYSLLWEEEEVRHEPEAVSTLEDWLTELPGLSYGYPLFFLSRSVRGVIDVNWLTLLGPEMTNQLGGQEKLARGLPPQVRVHSLGAGGALIQAGQGPVLGRATEAPSLEHYRAVGKAVSALRAPRAVLEEIQMWPLSGGQEVAWLDRFFP
ncbi:type VI immunity family protein [Hyalangium gracile]|uniref:type VI immunity family protein n=1 Tax=Hyalangium gracile TaxID=394092 RepID=UPI001CCC7051|nr:type VI immunity family protein [Hyalangium gracile]